MTRLKNSISSIQAGTWGEEPKGDETDVRCVRVADFDRPRLGVSDDGATLRSVPIRDQLRLRLDRGDLLIEKSGGTAVNPVGFVAMYDSEQPAVCSNFIGRMRLRPDQNPRYWLYAHAASYSHRLTQRSLNQTTGIQNLDLGAYLDEPFPCPPLAEQRAIAGFLDRETAQIDAMIEAQRELVERLEERRLAVITEAVDAAPPVPLKRWWRVIDCLHITAPFTDDSENFVVSIGQLGARRLDLSVAHSTSDEAFASLRGEGRVPVPGDVVMSRNATVGQTSVVAHDTPAFALGQDVVLMKPHDGAIGVYLRYTLMSGFGVQGLTNAMVGSTFKRVNVSQIKALRLPFPSPEDQLRISLDLDGVTARIDAMIAAAEAAIALMRERRSALISAAVTGRIDPYSGAERALEALELA